MFLTLRHLSPSGHQRPQQDEQTDGSPDHRGQATSGHVTGTALAGGVGDGRPDLHVFGWKREGTIVSEVRYPNEIKVNQSSCNLLTLYGLPINITQNHVDLTVRKI